MICFNTDKKVWFGNPAAFTQPAYGGPGSIGRNRLYGPRLVKTDLVFVKRLKLNERFVLETRVEGYNIFNHPQFSNPGSGGNTISTKSGSDVAVADGAFGLITSTIQNPDATTSARQLQFAMKLNF